MAAECAVSRKLGTVAYAKSITLDWGSRYAFRGVEIIDEIIISFRQIIRVICATTAATTGLSNKQRTTTADESTVRARRTAASICVAV
jgi:hypothetical protein